MTVCSFCFFLRYNLKNIHSIVFVAHYGVIEIHPPPPIVEGMTAFFKIQRANGNVNPARACYQVLPDTAKLNYGTVVHSCSYHRFK